MSVSLSGPPAGRPLPPADAARLEARAAAVLEALALGEAELSVTLVDDEAMAALNERYRGTSGPTDVLAFSLVEGEHAGYRGALLGEVVIDVEAAARQAPAWGLALDDELARLLIHGTLHLLGHDHEREDEARAMRAEEERIWAALPA